VSAELLEMLRDGSRPTRLDRIISSVAPGWGLARFRARAALAIGGAWVGSSKDRAELKNFNPIAQTPDEEQAWERSTLVARATDLERNDALAGGAISELTTSVVGTGLALHPEPVGQILGWTQDQISDWSANVKSRFQLWAGEPRECDISRRRNFYQSQEILYRTVVSRGDAFALLPTRVHPGGVWATKFQLLEGDRCLNPNGQADNETTSQGVSMDEVGGFKSYTFAKRYPNMYHSLGSDDYRTIDAWGSDGRRQVLHLFHEHRLDVRRGYPLLAPVISTLKQMSRLSDSELAASVVSSFFAVVITKPTSGAPGLLGSAKKTEGGQSFTELGHALVAELSPGESITNVAPTRPNGAFDPFWRSLLGQIAMRIQIPPEVLLKKFESSYTAARGALLQFWKFVTTERENLLAPNYCQPLYEAWLSEEIAAGRIQAPGYFANPLLRAAYSNARWIGDNPPILDPLKELLAAEGLVEYGFSTFEEQTSRLTNGDFEANIARQARERRQLKDAGITPGAPSAPVQPVVPPIDDSNSEEAQIPPVRGIGHAPGLRSALIALALKETV